MPSKKSLPVVLFLISLGGLTESHSVAYAQSGSLQFNAPKQRMELSPAGKKLIERLSAYGDKLLRQTQDEANADLLPHLESHLNQLKVLLNFYQRNLAALERDALRDFQTGEDDPSDLRPPQFFTDLVSEHKIAEIAAGLNELSKLKGFNPKVFEGIDDERNLRKRFSQEDDLLRGLNDENQKTDPADTTKPDCDCTPLFGDQPASTGERRSDADADSENGEEKCSLFPREIPSKILHAQAPKKTGKLVELTEREKEEFRTLERNLIRCDLSAIEVRDYKVFVKNFISDTPELRSSFKTKGKEGELQFEWHVGVGVNTQTRQSAINLKNLVLNNKFGTITIDFDKPTETTRAALGGIYAYNGRLLDNDDARMIMDYNNGDAYRSFEAVLERKNERGETVKTPVTCSQFLPLPNLYKEVKRAREIEDANKEKIERREKTNYELQARACPQRSRHKAEFDKALSDKVLRESYGVIRPVSHKAENGI